MISRVHRFHGHGSLRYAYQHGQTIRGPLTSLKFVLNERRQTYRLAVVVSKKISKSAVVRNRIRRRLYEAVRYHEPALSQPYDMVITVFHEQLAILPPDELARLVRAQLRQAGILPAKPAQSPSSRVKI
ncbi:MAG TPA: ribonuclease P protein component [Candidatus Limnocylindrales bacterium]|nr:ribonuclease P protein component [Candidatus Limnocylindrales bacterium]